MTGKTRNLERLEGRSLGTINDLRDGSCNKGFYRWNDRGREGRPETITPEGISGIYFIVLKSPWETGGIE